MHGGISYELICFRASAVINHISRSTPQSRQHRLDVVPEPYPHRPEATRKYPSKNAMDSQAQQLQRSRRQMERHDADTNRHPHNPRQHIAKMQLQRRSRRSSSSSEEHLPQHPRPTSSSTNADVEKNENTRHDHHAGVGAHSAGIAAKLVTILDAH